MTVLELEYIVIRGILVFESIIDKVSTIEMSKKFHSDIVDFVYDYYNKYKRIPSLEIIKQEIGGTKEDWNLILEREDNDDINFYVDKLYKLQQHDRVRSFLEHSIELYREEKIEDLDTYLRTFSSKSKNFSDIVQYSAWADEWERRKDERKNRSVHDVVNLGLSTDEGSIDFVLGGGIRKGEFGVVVGHLKMGKSMLLLYMACNVIKQLKGVLYVTLEGRMDLAERRFDAYFSDTYSDRLKNWSFTEEEESQLDKVFDAIQKYKLKLFIVHGRLYSYSILDLERDLKIYIEKYGIKPEFIVIDYGDIMVTKLGRNDKPSDLVEIWADLKNFAQDYNIAIFTAAQGDASSRARNLGGEGKVTWTDTGGSKMRNTIPDLALTLSQTKEEKLAGIVIITLDYARDSESGFALEVYPDNAKAVYIQKKTSVF